MSIQLLLERICSEGVQKHRLLVDSQSAEPISTSGSILICLLQKKPQKQVPVEVYLALDGFEAGSLKAGSYHLEAEASAMEKSDKGWETTLTILNREGDLIKRQSDRLRVYNLQVHYRVVGEDVTHDARALDLSPGGIGIRCHAELAVGQQVDVIGIGKATGLTLKEPIRYEVRVRPAGNKAGLLLAKDTAQATQASLADFFLQLSQIQRFWQSLLVNVRLQLGVVAKEGAMLSGDFACRQLRSKPAPRRILIDDAQFEEVAESLAMLSKLERVAEELSILVEQQKELKAAAPENRNLLKAFLDRVDHFG